MLITIVNAILGPASDNEGPFTHYSAMLHWAFVFLIIAIIAGLLGFGGIAGAATGIAKILFVIFLVLFVVFLITGRKPRV